MIVERELKFVLPNPEAVERLARVLGPEVGRREQVNHFLDTETRQIQASGRGLLRVRQEGDRHTLGLKLGAMREAGLFEAEELEIGLEPATANQLARGQTPAQPLELLPLRRLYELFGTLNLQFLGSLINLRRSFRLPGGELAELDQARFPNGSEDYELEVETSRPAEVRELLGRLFVEARVPLVAQGQTKFERFLERL